MTFLCCLGVLPIRTLERRCWRKRIRKLRAAEAPLQCGPQRARFSCIVQQRPARGTRLGGAKDMNTNWWTGATPQQKNWMKIGTAVLVVLVLLVVYNMAKGNGVPSALAQGQTQTTAEPYNWKADAFAARDALAAKLGHAVSACTAQES